MKSLALAFAVAALTVASAASASTVIYSASGRSEHASDGYVALPGAGRYKFSVKTSIPVEVDIETLLTYHYDYFLAPAPKPHGEFIEGNSWEETEYAFDPSTKQFTWVYVVPETKYTFFDAGAQFEPFGIAPGTPMYLEEKYQSPHFYFDLERWPYDGSSFDYSFIVTQLSVVPEPAVWAMMIAGFAGVGSSLRRQRRQRSMA